MAIRNPTNLNIKFTADLKIDQGSGVVNTQQLLTDTAIIPFSGYSTGSIDLETNSNEISLGDLSAGVFTSSLPLDFHLEGQNENTTTKLFAYNGDKTTIYVKNNQATVVTLEYVMGIAL